jgi:hypothetical protein
LPNAKEPTKTKNRKISELRESEGEWDTKIGVGNCLEGSELGRV